MYGIDGMKKKRKKNKNKKKKNISLAGRRPEKGD